MAREPVVAVDFLGLGTSMREREIELKSEKERGNLVKPSGSLSAAQSFAGDDDLETSRPRLVLGTGSSHLNGPLTFSLDQAMPWASIAGNAEDMERRDLAVPAFEEKRVEELTDADIMQLSGEECRRYMMKIKKERGVPCPTSNTIATTGPSTSKSRFRLETRPEEEKLVSKRGASSIKGVLLEASSLSAQSGPELQQDVAGLPSASGVRNVLPAPLHNVQSQASVGEEVQGGTCPSERAVHILDSNRSPLIPTNQEQLFAQPSGFGSPLPNYIRIPRTTEHSQRPLQANQSCQGTGVQVGVMSRSTGQSHLPGRPPTAQLTIFYSGMVNVYDGVPADKVLVTRHAARKSGVFFVPSGQTLAQAIMLLAGSGSSWSSSTMNPPPSVSFLPSTGGMASSSNSPARSGPAPAVAGISQPGPVTSPLVPTISVAAGLKQVAGRPTLHAELPQARKASLARFLEKRKDRVRGKAPYVPPIFSVKRDVGSSTPPREKSPSPINGNMCTRSPSPAKVNAGSRNRSLSPAQRPGPSQLSGYDTTSPKTQLVVLQQGPQPYSSEDQASTSATQRGPEDLMDWRSLQRTHLSSQDQKLEGSEEDKGTRPQRH